MTDVQVNPGGRLQHSDAQQTGWYPSDTHAVPPHHLRAATRFIFTTDNLEVTVVHGRCWSKAARARSAILTRAEMRSNLAKKLRIVSYIVDILTRLLKWVCASTEQDALLVHRAIYPGAVAKNARVFWYQTESVINKWFYITFSFGIYIYWN